VQLQRGAATQDSETKGNDGSPNDSTADLGGLRSRRRLGSELPALRRRTRQVVLETRRPAWARALRRKGIRQRRRQAA